MSHAYGQVRFNDGLILHFEYNGTSDVCISNLRDTANDVSDNWRNQEWLECDCGKDEEVAIANDYGGGVWFPNGRACRYCRAITFDPVADYEGEIDGLPDWWIPWGE